MGGEGVGCEADQVDEGVHAVGVDGLDLLGDVVAVVHDVSGAEPAEPIGVGW